MAPDNDRHVLFFKKYRLILIRIGFVFIFAFPIALHGASIFDKLKLNIEFPSSRNTDIYMNSNDIDKSFYDKINELSGIILFIPKNAKSGKIVCLKNESRISNMNPLIEPSNRLPMSILVKYTGGNDYSERLYAKNGEISCSNHEFVDGAVAVGSLESSSIVDTAPLYVTDTSRSEIYIKPSDRTVLWYFTALFLAVIVVIVNLYSIKEFFIEK